MRIHSDVLTFKDIVSATKARGMKGVVLDNYSEHGSRKRKRGFEVKLLGNSPYAPNGGSSGTGNSGEKAAQWDEWGIFLDELFSVDPDMVTQYYQSYDDFMARTDGRFNHLTAEETHRRHTWKHTGTPREFECKCGAIRRY